MTRRAQITSICNKSLCKRSRFFGDGDAGGFVEPKLVWVHESAVEVQGCCVEIVSDVIWHEFFFLDHLCSLGGGGPNICRQWCHWQSCEANLYQRFGTGQKPGSCLHVEGDKPVHREILSFSLISCQLCRQITLSLNAFVFLWGALQTLAASSRLLWSLRSSVSL